ncbi:hypothetical protein CHELA1G2_13701 [Hyphomicrobiales bacterium]|nr:hypothetical protein CHELA1G2_13701 [Hyphomicrobiales bacterium]
MVSYVQSLDIMLTQFRPHRAAVITVGDTSDPPQVGVPYRMARSVQNVGTVSGQRKRIGPMFDRFNTLILAPSFDESGINGLDGELSFSQACDNAYELSRDTRIVIAQNSGDRVALFGGCVFFGRQGLLRFPLERFAVPDLQAADQSGCPIELDTASASASWAARAAFGLSSNASP